MSLAEALLDLQELTRQLRRECPWDREQTERTIVPHTVEEAYEVADAALERRLGGAARTSSATCSSRSTSSRFCSRSAARATSSRSRATSTRSSCAAIRTSSATPTRAPPGRVRERWEAVKTEQEGREGIFHDVPEALPALLQARKVQRRAAAVGYDWPDLAGPLAKVREELGELEEAMARAGRRLPRPSPTRRVVHEVGDLLFTVVNVARRLNVDPELALRATTRRFTATRRAGRRARRRRGEDWRALDLDAQDAYYERAKESLA